MRDLVRLSLLAHFALLIMSVLWLRLEYPYKRQVCTAGVEISSQNAVPVFSTPSYQCTSFLISVPMATIFGFPRMHNSSYIVRIRLL